MSRYNEKFPVCCAEGGRPECWASSSYVSCCALPPPLYIDTIVEAPGRARLDGLLFVRRGQRGITKATEEC